MVQRGISPGLTPFERRASPPAANGADGQKARPKQGKARGFGSRVRNVDRSRERVQGLEIKVNKFASGNPSDRDRILP